MAPSLSKTGSTSCSVSRAGFGSSWRMLAPTRRPPRSTDRICRCAGAARSRARGDHHAAGFDPLSVGQGDDPGASLEPPRAKAEAQVHAQLLDALGRRQDAALG